MAACSSGTLGSAEDESNLWPWGSQGKVGREGVPWRGRALRGEDRENISAEGSVRAALGSELHAMHGRSRKIYFPPGFFFACRQGKDRQCPASAAPSRGTRGQHSTTHRSWSASVRFFCCLL